MSKNQMTLDIETCIDPNPETKPSCPDPVDMKEAECEMLFFTLHNFIHCLHDYVYGSLRYSASVLKDLEVTLTWFVAPVKQEI